MQELANFSIETDSIVLLKFKDGTEKRVARRNLSQYVAASDMEKIRAAYHLRRNFLKSHMPRTGAYLLLALTGALLLGLAARPAMQAVAQIIQGQPVEFNKPLQSGIAKSLPSTMTPMPSPSVIISVSPATPMSSAKASSHALSDRLSDKSIKPAHAKSSLMEQVSRIIAPVVAPIAQIISTLAPSSPAASEPAATPQPSASITPSPSPSVTPEPVQTALPLL